MANKKFKFKDNKNLLLGWGGHEIIGRLEMTTSYWMVEYDKNILVG